MPAVHSIHGLTEHCLRPRCALTLRLYTNEFTPHRNQTIADFTEADFPGYKPIELSPSDWTITSESPLTLQCSTQEFTLAEDLAEPVNIYGHYLTGGDKIVSAEDSRVAKLPYSAKMKYSRYQVTPTIREKT